MPTEEPMTVSQQTFAETVMIARAALLGLAVPVDPDVADYMGAFEELALDAAEAEESFFDVDPDTGIVLDIPDAKDGETVQ